MIERREATSSSRFVVIHVLSTTTMGQFDDWLVKLKGVAELFFLTVVSLFWALVAGLLMLTNVMNDGLLRL